jgi:hypothetical protein
MDSTPSIFKKKLNKSIIKKLNYIENDSGIIKHFPPAAQEWYNSIYTYNTIYIKGIHASDISLMKLLKGYFSMFFNHKFLGTKYISKLDIRRSPRKIFIGKGELKHTSKKVIITFYVHNTEKISLIRKYKLLYYNFFSPKKKSWVIKKGNKFISFLKKPLKKRIIFNQNGRDIILYNRPYTVEEFLNTPKYVKTSFKPFPKKKVIFNNITYFNVYYSILEFLIRNLSYCSNMLNKYYEHLNELVKIEALSSYERLLIFMNLIKFYTYKYPNYEYYKKVANRKYLKNLYRLRYLLKFNSVKFEKPFITKLVDIVERIYGKKVEFNIVNLNKVYFNSDIFTQAIITKLRKRKNRINRMLRRSLNKVKVIKINKNLRNTIDALYIRNYLVNDIRNAYINDMFNNLNVKKDSLNKLLLNYFPSADKLKENSLKYYIFKYLKHSKLAGIRLEAKGRITKRFKASRSLFKLIWKGSLKNIDSSNKKLSAVMLRGNTKSNVQYSMLKSKYRIGAFGLKGWVSSN